MRNATVTTTVQITEVVKNVPDNFELHKESMKKSYERKIQKLFDADNVLVTDIHYALSDAEEINV